jgi:hypothetical protein
MPDDDYHELEVDVAGLLGAVRDFRGKVFVTASLDDEDPGWVQAVKSALVDDIKEMTRGGYHSFVWTLDVEPGFHLYIHPGKRT